MSFLEILERYAQRRPEALSGDAEMEFEVVAQQAPPEVVSEGLADAFRAEQTPPFGDMVAQLFQRSDPEQRAGLLNLLVGTAGPAAFAEGPLDEVVRYLRDGSRIGADEADALLPHQAKEVAERALEHHPGVIERVSEYYARHPELVATLGKAALTVALANMARSARQ
jgi:hypothetical protein